MHGLFSTHAVKFVDVARYEAVREFYASLPQVLFIQTHFIVKLLGLRVRSRSVLLQGSRDNQNGV
jgi:hypothetical protein